MWFLLDHMGHGKQKAESMNEKCRTLGSILPEIPCPPDCSLCCEIALGIKKFGSYQAVEFVFLDKDSSCVCLKDGRCSKYSERPMVCRVFFKSKDGLDCFRGLEPIGGKVSAEMIRRIMWCEEAGTVLDAKAIRAEYLRKSNEQT